MRTLGFLHTANIHVWRFDALVRKRDPSVVTMHVVDVELLTKAQDSEQTLGVQVRVLQHLLTLQDRGADVLVCTCSTLGAVAERHELFLKVPVLRVDRPMARRAVQCGTRVGVIAALASTLQLTEQLLHEEAHLAGTDLSVHVVLVEAAWTAFESGDIARYVSVVAAEARELAEKVDVIVLAQASMAEATEQLEDLTIAVLSSPSAAVDAAVALIRS